MATVNELTKIKERVETSRQEAERAAGALEQVLARIQREFDCNTVAAAKTELHRLTNEADNAEAAFDKAMAKFKAKYGEQL